MKNLTSPYDYLIEEYLTFRTGIIQVTKEDLRFRPTFSDRAIIDSTKQRKSVAVDFYFGQVLLNLEEESCDISLSRFSTEK